VTPTLSVAVKELTATVRLVAVAGRVKLTTGAVVSAGGGNVTVTLALLTAETLPAASLAQA